MFKGWRYSPTLFERLGIYIYKIFIILIWQLLLRRSLLCKKNYTTTVKVTVKKRLTKVERSKINIDSPLNEIIIGLLLGDGHLQCRNGNSRFIYGQSSLRKHHLNYFNHIFDLFKPFISKDFVPKSRTFINKRTNISYKSISFATLTLPCFNYYRNLFYNKDNKKIVPLNINQFLTPRGLAYWIMDDGSLQNKGLHLSTYGFTLVRSRS
jgi:hypothetical protein